MWIDLERDLRQVVHLKMNRPEARNALSLELLDELNEHLVQLRSEDLRALVLSGEGSGFSAGADLKERLGQSAAQRSAHTLAVHRAADALATFPVPVIAAVHGFAVAGGAELALGCDVRVSSPDAFWSFPEVRLGIFPGGGAPERLPALVGAGKARELLFTGRRVGAEEALAIGLVQRVAEDPLALALALAGEIANAAPLAVRALKRAMDESLGLTPEQAAECVRRYREPLDGTRDYQEALDAFAERRSPRFEGR